MTRQQQLIKDIIYGSHEHPTAEEIFNLAREKMPHIAIGTVYRNLSAMAAENMIRRIPMGDGEPDRYDRTVTEHAHAVCSVCGRVSDVDTTGFREFMSARAGFAFDSFEISLRYVCDECRQVGSGDAQDMK